MTVTFANKSQVIFSCSDLLCDENVVMNDLWDGCRKLKCLLFYVLNFIMVLMITGMHLKNK